MGSSESGDEDCPPHSVTVSDFYIGQFEVSQELWVSIMGSNPSAYQPKERRDSLPVENVSYEDVQLFIKQLNNATTYVAGPRGPFLHSGDVRVPHSRQYIPSVWPSDGTIFEY